MMESEELSFRYATENDCAKILLFIRELASYEKMLDEMVATEELLKEWLFEKKKAEVIFACVGDVRLALLCSSITSRRS